MITTLLWAGRHPSGLHRRRESRHPKTFLGNIIWANAMKCLPVTAKINRSRNWKNGEMTKNRRFWLAVFMIFLSLEGLDASIAAEFNENIRPAGDVDPSSTATTA